MSGKVLGVVLVLVIMVASAWCTDSAEAQIAVIDGLVSFWPLDNATIDGDVVKDVVGVNDGSMQGDVKIVPGKINDALEFDGVDSFVDCGGDESLNLTAALTIELWMKPNADGEGGNNAGPLCRAVDGGSWNWQLRYNAPGSFMGFQFNDAPGGATWISVQENLPHSEWYHVAGTFDGSDIVCYLNGEEKDRGSIGGINGSTDNFFMGQDGWVNIFDGVVDEVRMYDRALSENEVKQNYQSRSQLTVDPAGKLAITWGDIKLEG
ncbi:LamG domain-containing protein [Candidatus Poribacteria bacterium]